MKVWGSEYGWIECPILSLYYVYEQGVFSAALKPQMFPASDLNFLFANIHLIFCYICLEKDDDFKSFSPAVLKNSRQTMF